MVFLAIILLVLAIAVHELGHALEMKKHGIEIESMGLGLNLPYLPKLKFKSRYFDCPVYVTPLLIAAYVKPTASGDSRLEELEEEQLILIFGAGIWMNFWMTFALTAVILALTHALSVTGWVVLIASPLILPWKRQFCRFGVIILGLVALGLLLHAFYTTPIRECVGGPASLVRIATHSKTLIEATGFGAFIAINLALLNCLPFFPLDGGRILRILLSKHGFHRLAENAPIIGAACLVLLVSLALFNDVMAFFR